MLLSWCFFVFLALISRLLGWRTSTCILYCLSEESLFCLRYWFPVFDNSKFYKPFKAQRKCFSSKAESWNWKNNDPDNLMENIR